MGGDETCRQRVEPGGRGNGRSGRANATGSGRIGVGHVFNSDADQRLVVGGASNAENHGPEAWV